MICDEIFPEKRANGETQAPPSRSGKPEPATAAAFSGDLRKTMLLSSLLAVPRNCREVAMGFPEQTTRKVKEKSYLKQWFFDTRSTLEHGVLVNATSVEQCVTRDEPCCLDWLPKHSS